MSSAAAALLDKLFSSVISSLSCCVKSDKVNPLKMEELPKAFVSSLRVLFEILDEDSDGYVELAEIEKRWQGNTVTGLPAGVVDSLRGIAPTDGRLSFDRFCTGLKITLEKNRSSNKARQVQVRGSRNSKDERQPTTATVRPNNVVHPMRTKSAPQLQDIPPKPARQMRTTRSSTSALPDERKTLDPPDYAAHMQKTKDKLRKNSEKSEEIYSSKGIHSKHQSIDAVDPTLDDKKRVQATIKSWQKEKRRSTSPHQRQPDVIYNRKDDVSLYAHPPQQSFPADTSKVPSDYEKVVRRTSEGTQKAGGRRKKDEPRRHTLSNGIDYNMLKRMKHLEQERDTFLEGLEALELARDWYRQQLASIRDKQDRINKAQLDFSEDMDHQDMVMYRTTRITELNRQLRALIATPEKGFPNHMNLAIPKHQRPPGDTGASLMVNKLKHQNKQLTEEVSSKSERISKLEQEKAALIRQLFEARGRNRDLPENTTFL